MARELRKMQERMLLRQRFGEQAIEFPDSHNPLRGAFKTIEQQQQAHDELQGLMKWTAEVLEQVHDFELSQFLKKNK